MQLKPVLGAVQLTFYAVGVIVGAGVYSIIGSTAGIAQEGLWFSFVIGALVAFLTGISYAEMATSFPVAGAEYVYVRRASPQADWAAFGVGMIIIFGGSAASATVAVGFGGYLKTFIDVPIALSAIFLLTLCTAFNIWGIRESSWANILFTLVEVGGLLLVVAAGLTQDGFAAPLAMAPPPGIMAAAAILFFVYLGFEEIANVVEETRDPARSVPRAIFWGLAITTFLYVLVSLAVVNLAPPAVLAASEAPLATALETVWPRAGVFLSAIALFATANTVLISLIATSRLAFAMARDREIPEVCARLLPGPRTPWIAAALTFALAAVLVPIGDLTVLAGLSSFSALLAFLAVNVTLIVLRYREPDQPRPFRAPLSIGRMPLLPLAAIASILALIVHFETEIYVGGVVAIALSAVAFALRQWWTRTSGAAA
jgi:APA family basic amino acid/polyamine antiporter